jgi:hypothetical protein
MKSGSPESRHEAMEPKPEFEPVDRFAELKRLLRTEGNKPLVSADIAGMEEMFVEVLRASGFAFEIIPPEKSGGGPDYEVQRGNLIKVAGEETVAALEAWGEGLFAAAERKTHDKKTGKSGVAIAQVVLDFYRFAAKLRTQDRENNNDHQRAVETVEKLNERIRKWNDGEMGSPSPCSGEIMAKVVDWMLTGEMAVPESHV